MYMRTSTLLLAASVAVEARFGQEQGNGAIQAISALSDLGNPGQAATLAGASIQFLLAAANPCAKLKQADAIVAALGTSDRAIAAARGLVAAEQNFNPFAVSVPNICSDASLPATAQLRGVVPLVDPAVVGSAVENANAEKSKTTPFAANGMSVADVMKANGFSNFTSVGSDGAKAGGNANAGGKQNTGGQQNAGGKQAVPVTCGGNAGNAAKNNTGNANSGKTGGNAAGTGAVTNAVTGNFPGFVASSIAGLDFGKCVPTMKFEPGLNGRKDTEFTFQAVDPLVNKGQQEALNPAIIARRIKDQLTNVCGANQAAKDAATKAEAQVTASGKKDASVANAWNSALGFAGADINPDGAPKAGLVGHA
ncbi:uncharacterized protein E0L32_007045 [Thyridium curvatum]|uniref:Uncharacterized protein n=1 Tax=Thyridium curvatum TaxID=1093900 RepID=A0A507B490_9PEZI|nr:uncharacterized protein E0L32_007045 [Thyridium curvatum]TPX12159.1 hypothetical protein E0L32_007045 [Thyridium curvatum]